jgi:exodeoxyribonuclease VII small subunit
MEQMKYETAIQRLEEIVAQLERGGQTLDDAVRLFEEGAALANFCGEALKTAELKIKQLSEAAGDEAI